MAISGAPKERRKSPRLRAEGGKSSSLSLSQDEAAALLVAPIGERPKSSDLNKRKSLLLDSLKDESLQANEAQAIAELLNLK